MSLQKRNGPASVRIVYPVFLPRRVDTPRARFPLSDIFEPQAELPDGARVVVPADQMHFGPRRMDHVPTRMPFIQIVSVEEAAMLPVCFFRKSSFRGPLLRPSRRDLGRRIIDHEAFAERSHDARELIEAGPTRRGFEGRDPPLTDANAIARMCLAQSPGIPHGARRGAELRGSGNGVVHGGHVRALVF